MHRQPSSHACSRGCVYVQVKKPLVLSLTLSPSHEDRNCGHVFWALVVISLSLTVFSMWMGKKYLCSDSLTQGEEEWLWTYLRLIWWLGVGGFGRCARPKILYCVREAVFAEKTRIAFLGLDLLSSSLHLTCVVFSLEERFLILQEFQGKSAVSKHVG